MPPDPTNSITPDSHDRQPVPHTVGHAAWPDRPDPLPPQPSAAAPAAPPPVMRVEDMATPHSAVPERTSKAPLLLLLLSAATAWWWLNNRRRQPALDARTAGRLRGGADATDVVVPSARDIVVA